MSGSKLAEVVVAVVDRIVSEWEVMDTLDRGYRSDNRNDRPV